jgi:hypothetical protein
LSIASVTTRIVIWLRILLAGVFCIPAALILFHVARDRFGGQSVPLSVNPNTCGAAACVGDQCTRMQWIGSDTLRVDTIVYVGTTTAVDPEGASVVVANGVVRLLYKIKGRKSDGAPANGPVPACVMPISVAFSLSGLPRQPYVVTTAVKSLLADWMFVALATALLLVAWFLSAPALGRSKRQQDPEGRA